MGIKSYTNAISKTGFILLFYCRATPSLAIERLLGAGETPRNVEKHNTGLLLV
jgi:hypothetical protein